MRYWDSSAVIPLCLRETTSSDMRRTAEEDGDIVVWWATQTECISALSRRRREGILRPDAEKKARAILSRLCRHWAEVQPSDRVRQRAERLLALHPLRTADAFQLAAALVWAEEMPSGLDVVCLDQNLKEAAGKEGFTVLP